MTSIRQSVTDRPSRFRTDSSGVREQRPIDFPVGESVPRHVVSAARGGRQRMCVPLYMVVSLSLWVASPAKLRGSARETREQVNASHALVATDQAEISSLPCVDTSTNRRPDLTT